MSTPKGARDESHYLSSSPEWLNSPISNTGGFDPNQGEENTQDGQNEDYYDETEARTLTDSQVREDFTMDFWRPLQQADAEARYITLESLIDLLRTSLHSEKRDLIKTHLRTIVRYATEVPFEDLITAFQKFLKEVEQSGVVIPEPSPYPSSFIPKTLFPPVYNADPILRQLYIDVFLQNGRISHLNRVLMLHPTYFEKYYVSLSFIMREPGPLPLEWRNYLAILTASRFRCKYIVNLNETEFLLNSGDSKWLQGIHNIPSKLYNLLNVLQTLCHQPWLMSKEHIAPLVKGEDSWSIGELVHAMIIICTVKSMCGIIYGCGVRPEVDLSDPTIIVEESNEEEEVPTTVRADTNKIMELLTSKYDVGESEEPKEQHFYRAESADTDNSITTSSDSTEPPSDLSRYVGEFKQKHEDFDVRSRNYSIFRVQDYYWKEHGFELVRRFLPDAATLLDEEFDHIYNMTYNMFNQSANVDTFPFRRAIWQYVQRIKGMFHDDYNYQEVNVFLNKVSKNYIKKITCVPETVTRNDFTNLGYELKPDEKVHVAALAVESSKQSELLYGLHAVMQHMYNR